MMRPPLHPLRSLAQSVERALEIDRDELVEIAIAGIGYIGLQQDASIIDQHVDATELRLGGVEHRMHCCRIADVGLECRGAAARFHNRPDKRLGRPGALRVVHEDSETIARKALSDRPADAARGARYNCNFAFRGAHLNAPDGASP